MMTRTNNPLLVFILTFVITNFNNRVSYEKGGSSRSTGGMAYAFNVERIQNAHSLDKFVIGTAALINQEKPEILLNGAIERGFNTFDLARTYGGGQSEKIFGNWLSTKDPSVRDDLTIITKGGMGEDKYGDPNRPILTFESLQKELSMSLESLKVDYVDWYMLHRDDPRVEVEDIVNWMNLLIDSGKIKNWGVSNWPLQRTKDALEYANSINKAGPTINSPHFSLAVPKEEIWPTTVSVAGPEEVGTIEWYKNNDIKLFCWEVLAKGFMALPEMWEEKTVNKQMFGDKTIEIGTNEWRLQRIQRAYCTKENYMRRVLAKELALRHGLSLAQISTLYALSRGPHVHVLLGVDKCEHLDEMLALQNLRLNDIAMDHLTHLVDIYGERPRGKKSREQAATEFLKRKGYLETSRDGFNSDEELMFTL